MISRRQLAMIPLILALLACEYGHYRQKSAEKNLPGFYSSLVNGDLPEARARISEAMRISPNDARFAAWNAYLDGQTVPAEAACNGPAESLTVEQRRAAEHAVAAYRQASALNEFDGQPHHNLAWLYHRIGDEQKAVAEQEKAIALDQPNPILHASFGLLLERLGQIRRADEEYARAVTLSPQLLESRFFEDLRRRDPERTTKLLQTVTSGLASELERSQSPVLKAKLGRFVAEMGDSDRATALISEALRELPNLTLAWANLGDLYAVRSERDAALSCYRKAVVLDGSLVMPYLHMADIYRSRGDTRKALRNYEVAARNADAKLPPSAAHDSRLYRGSLQPIDSQLPPGLFRYMSSCDGPKAYQALAELAPMSRQTTYFRTRGRDCAYIQSPYRICR